MNRFAYHVQMAPNPRDRLPVRSAAAQARIDREAGAAVERLRLARGLSQRALGAVCGVTGQQIDKYESGKNRMSLGRATVIAEALGTEVTALFPGLGARSETPDPGIGPEPGPEAARRRLRGAQLARLALRIEDDALDHLLGLAKALAGRGPRG